MLKKSAGILAYHLQDEVLKVLLVHPGGPFFAKKDDGVWSIPKGEYVNDEDSEKAARREFEEETGNVITNDKLTELWPIKLKSGKEVTAFAVENYFEKPYIKSNYFEIEWPPKSGQTQQFLEVDRAEWFTIEEAKIKVNPAQIPFLEELAQTVKS